VATRGAEGSNETAQEGVALAEPLSWFAMQITAGQWTDLVSGSGLSTAIMSSSRACKHALPGKGSYDFVHHRTDDGRTFRAFRALNILDDYGRECPLSVIAAQSTAGQRTNLFILRGVPAFVRSDNGPEFIAEAVRGWVKAVGARTASIEPGSPLSAMPCIACRAARGRMDIAKASMVACGTTF